MSTLRRKKLCSEHVQLKCTVHRIYINMNDTDTKADQKVELKFIDNFLWFRIRIMFYSYIK